jgi:hypothetical protein
MTGVAVRVVLEIILMLRLGFPEGTGGRAMRIQGLAGAGEAQIAANGVTWRFLLLGQRRMVTRR